MAHSLTKVGGFRLGWVNGTIPFGILSVSTNEIKLNATIAGSYSFRPDQVVSLEQIPSSFGLGGGIRIHHLRRDYPEKVIFWAGDAKALLVEIQKLGFHPSAPKEKLAHGDGMPWRWQGLVSFAVLWNLLFAADQVLLRGTGQKLGNLSLLAFFLTTVSCVMLHRSELLQSLMLKPNRDPGEVRPYLRCTAFIFILVLLFIKI